MSKLNHLYNEERYSSLLTNASDMGGQCIEALSKYTVETTL